MAVVEQAVTDTIAANAGPLTFEPLFTDTIGAVDRFTGNDGLITTSQQVTATETVSVSRSAATGGAYTTGYYPYTAIPVFPTHTWVTVLSYEDVHGTQGQ